MRGYANIDVISTFNKQSCIKIVKRRKQFILVSRRSNIILKVKFKDNSLNKVNRNEIRYSFIGLSNFAIKRCLLQLLFGTKFAYLKFKTY